MGSRGPTYRRESSADFLRGAQCLAPRVTQGSDAVLFFNPEARGATYLSSPRRVLQEPGDRPREFAGFVLQKNFLAFNEVQSFRTQTGGNRRLRHGGSLQDLQAGTAPDAQGNDAHRRLCNQHPNIWNVGVQLDARHAAEALTEPRRRKTSGYGEAYFWMHLPQVGKHLGDKVFDSITIRQPIKRTHKENEVVLLVQLG